MRFKDFLLKLIAQERTVFTQSRFFKVVRTGFFVLIPLTLFFSFNNIQEVPPDLNLSVPAKTPELTPGIAREATPTEMSLPTPPLPPPSLERMKREGCVADGFLSGYGEKTKTLTKLINRSHCYYLHRALETWLDPPDFEEAAEIKDQIDKPDMVYGMFIAEAIDTKANFYYPAKDREFEFEKMCRPGSKNDWGEHTCKPSFASLEYREYLREITSQAVEMGIQVFLFGQIFYQDSLDAPLAPQIIEEMRAVAHYAGTEIIIGAQTNDITDEKYLRSFDFIEGGVGLHEDGSIEKGPCFSRWWQKEGDWCWALLWHDRFAKKANNVFIHLDWSGRLGDDMSTFARMNATDRHTTLTRLHQYFMKRDMAFLLPILAPLPKNNGSCFGPKERFYSPDDKYSCDDEDIINALLKRAQNTP